MCSYNARMKERSTIFYAWQSDTPSKLNHYFIRDAAQDALRRLNAEWQLEEADRMQLDHDTQGVPGSPPIAETICAKIDTCRLFLSDLTTVGSYRRTSDKGLKKNQNGNVLIELGYARKALGVNRIITVMNTAFGGLDDLPFDLKHLRGPIRYELVDPKDSQLKARRAKLVEDLGTAFRAAMEALSKITAKQASQDVAIQKAVATRREYEEHALSNQFRKFTPTNAILTLTLIPLENPSVPIDLPRRREDLMIPLQPLFPGRTCSPENRAQSIVMYTSAAHEGTSRRTSVTELHSNGYLFAACEMPHDPVGNKEYEAIPFHQV